MRNAGVQEERTGNVQASRPSDFARRLLAEWRRLGLQSRDARGVVVAVSGGADSTALLLALDELRRRELLAAELRVAHLDHGLRSATGAADARAVEELARHLGYECTTARVRVGERARISRDNLEQAARRERYEFLSRVARWWGAEVVATGHTLDDQAETVLLALLRGSGADGLGGMAAARPLSEGDSLPVLARPLMSWARRAETREYCASRGVVPRVDAMNEDERFARVRLRRRVLPLLETFNPRAVEAIARAASLLREDADALDQEARLLLREAEDANSVRVAGTLAGVPALRVEALAGAEMPAVRRRALRRWLESARGDLRRVELVHVLAVEKLLYGQRGGRVAELPGGGRVERRRRWLIFYPARSSGGGKDVEKIAGET